MFLICCFAYERIFEGLLKSQIKFILFLCDADSDDGVRGGTFVAFVFLLKLNCAVT